MNLAVRAFSVLAAVAGLVATPSLQSAAAVEAVPPPARSVPVDPTQPPPALVARLQTLGLGFEGHTGIAVMDLQDGWVAAYNGLSLSPQQSVSKLWVAMTVLDAVDHGRIGLDDPVVVRRKDLSVFNQPIRARLTHGPYRTTIDELLYGAIAQSDNAANDILVRRVGGPKVVQKAIAARGLGSIYSGPEERVLQSKIAAVAWRPQYSFGQAFWTARDRIAPAVRVAALDAYLADPDDGATPIAMVRALARLKRGELLSPASTGHLLQIMAATETGPMRLKAGLGPGWTIAHKTGTGQDLADLATGYNDVGYLTAPDGRGYAVAVMIASTHHAVPDRQSFMAAVAQAVVAQHDGLDPNLPPRGPAPLPLSPSIFLPPPSPAPAQQTP